MASFICSAPSSLIRLIKRIISLKGPSPEHDLLKVATHSAPSSRLLPVAHVSYFSPFTFIFNTFNAFMFLCIYLALFFVCFLIHPPLRLIFLRMCWLWSFPALAAARGYTKIVFYSTPTSIPQRLVNKLRLSNSPIQTITTFTTQ